ncbi:MAG: threonine--tRNA ligase [Candidatus Hydrogenedentes bacterium]|nr:threonine--tRNA ligase [Candidatus Hydrogenedentota bacterium]
MSTITVVLPDGSKKSLEPGATALTLAETIGPRLAKAATGARINGEVKSLPTPLTDGDTVEILTFDSQAGKDVMRHSAAHLMASAIMRLRPNTKLAIGPAIEDGFYYDIDTEPPITEADFPAIEAEMERIVQEDARYERREVSKQEALDFFSKRDEKFKTELISDLEDGTITFYSHGEFTDLCRGPHLPSTGRIKAFKLLSVAGAYWRGDEKRPMLQRIYGTAFPSKKELDEYIRLRAEAEKRDHRKLGKQLDLFSFHGVGPGFPFFHPKGMVVLNALMEFWRSEHRKRRYHEIRTPIILERILWEQSGHWDHYRENMYFTKIDERDFAVKPMNCPGAMLIYKSGLRSYRDLPLRMAEVGTVHRHEKSGVLHGLSRVRMFTQDDAHIFVTPEQIKDEVISIIDFVDHVYKTFGFDYHVELSTRPEDSIGTEEMWENATTALRSALEAKGMTFKINEGDGAFYGPKIDFHIKDSIKRSWQCATIQCDFSMPDKFDLDYTGPDGQAHRPVAIHRVIYGSIERFIGILIEHFAGAFPLWLAPAQAMVIPVASAYEDYAREVRDRLFDEGFRVEMDASDETIKYKIRAAQTQQIPYMLVIGEREQSARTVALRHRRRGDEGSVGLDELIARFHAEIASKKIDADES